MATKKKTAKKKQRDMHKKQDAIALLKDDHKEVKKLLKQINATTEHATAQRRELLEQIAQAIKAHTTIEEEIFYPAYKEAVTKKDDQKLYYEAMEEHHAADLVLTDVKKADPSTLNFAGKVKVLKELIEHHADEEEEDMFPAARKVLSRADLATLGERMLARKHELLNGHATKRAPSQRPDAQPTAQRN